MPEKDSEGFYSRTEAVIGKEAVERLKNSKIIIFGVGGVGGYALEALVRVGVGKLTLVDGDTVSTSNLNRQIIATIETVGQPKAEVAKKRALSINPNSEVDAVCSFFTEENKKDFDLRDYDYVIDAIDSVSNKIALIVHAKESGVKIISSMGAGNKLDPSRFRSADISKTYQDPLAKVVRTRLKKLGITSLKTVFSDEEPINPNRERTPGSLSFVPSAAGLVIAAEVVKDLCGLTKNK